MKLPRQPIDDSNLRGNRAALLKCLTATAAVTLAACAVVRPVSVTPPALDRSDAVVQVADADVLAVSPAMEEFLERYILPYDNRETRISLLALAVINGGLLGFEYDDTRTLTAAEAFQSRSGNCISHANMLIALARRAGIDARYQEIAIQPEWTSREHTLLINKHVNVLLRGTHTEYQIDVSGMEYDKASRRKIVSDRDAKAMYFNNLGADALIENDLPTAYSYMLKAIEVSPQVADTWVNLGVVFSRNKQIDDAELSHKTALQLDPREFSAMNNLYSIYIHQKRFEAADEYKRRVEDYRRRNPYYLYMLANEARDESRYEDSVRLLKRATKIKDDDHRLHFALARALSLAGDTASAGLSLQRARELAPADTRASYELTVEQLRDGG